LDGRSTELLRFARNDEGRVTGPHAAAVARFAADLDALVPAGQSLGIAVSGGPDSLALLLLAAAARPGTLEAATVDHALRAESRDEAKGVSSLCKQLGIPHHILTVEWDQRPSANIQARAREARYFLLDEWALRRGLPAIATAHHADDQAETLLMRLARGAGLSGLVGTRKRRLLDGGVQLVRPLLGWRRSELAEIVAGSGLTPVDDPANRDPRHDRTRFRGLLDEAEWANVDRLAASAAWLAEADEALVWMTAALATSRIAPDGDALTLDAEGLPRELQRRLLLRAFDRFDARRPRGPDLDRAMHALSAGKTATLSGLKLSGGNPWRLEHAPARRNDRPL
jgi:tRNA(Ile)-lysidine synthase